MRKIIICGLFALGLSFVPEQSYAKELVAKIQGTIELEDERTVQIVTFSDGCIGYFFSDGSYFVYNSNGDIVEGRVRE